MCDMTDRMAILGKNVAGLAHELNNPAAAAQRAASGLRTALEHIKRGALEYDCRFDDAERALMRPILEETIERRQKNARQSPLERADLEERLASWLDQHGVDDAWSIAPDMLDAGAPAELLLGLDGKMRPETVTAALIWVKKLLHLQALVDDVEQSTTRISEVVKAMKTFSRPEDVAPVLLDLHQTLDTTLTLYSYRLKHGVTVVRRYCDSLPHIMGFPGRLQQVWTNIVDNALDVMPNGGTLTLTTWVDDGWARVDIADSGPGMSAEVQQRVFEPFFTTKGGDKGTGFGLDISRRIIVDDHHGKISCASTAQGTIFTVTLPLAPVG